MTKRTPVSAPKNIWFDAQQVDNTDLTLEQDFNDAIDASTINNHIGTGVLPEVLVQNILFDSSLVSGLLDGSPISSQNQPADSNYGNQLEITLTNSRVSVKKAVKVGIIGLDFQGNLQYETFYFRSNESQVSKKHFTQILTLLFNDLIGDPALSFNLGGQLLIKEALPFTLSRDTVMVAQDIQPNLFFRDFFLDGFSSLQALLQEALPLYNFESLNIFTSEVDSKILLNNDVTTQIGEKFLATTNNIQKITFLLSIRNLDVSHETDFVWNGDLVVSIYPLQSSLECISDIAPNLPIDFSPSNIPIAQVSVNYASLQATGVELDSVPQPVDFVFSNSPVAAGTILLPDTYYAVTVKRSGSANKCDILLSVGSNLIDNSRITTFTGSLWIDIPEEQLWFKVSTDSAKVSDGQAYEAGHGIIIPKTTVDELTQATIDYSKENLQFVGNEVFRAVAAASTLLSEPIPDQRTGNPVLSRQQFVPDIKLLNSIDITNLEKASEPLLIGAISDRNRKFFDSISSLINSNLYSATMAKDELVIRIIDDTTDTARFDSSVVSLQSNLLNGDFEGARFYPNSTTPSISYRIADARLCAMVIGDVNGDGMINSEDLDLLNTYMDFDLTIGRPLHTQFTSDGYFTTVNNGYNSLISPFINQFSVHFHLVDPLDNSVVADGYDGVLIAHPTDPRLAQFTSASVSFSSVTGLTTHKLVLIVPSVEADYGSFEIASVDVTSDVLTIRKIILSGDAFGEMLRADINGDFHITSVDGYLLSEYIDRFPLTTSPTTTYPAPSTNPFTKIGTKFNVIRFRLEQFIDRNDDYSSNPSLRSTTTHPKPDIFVADGYFASHNFVTFPSSLVIEKKLTWNESLVVTNSNPRLVPSVFTSLEGFTQNSCTLEGITCNIFGSSPSFDPGRVDYFVPNNLIIGDAGELKRPDGDFYKVDFEVGTIILEIPDGIFGSEKTINILDDFISDYTDSGITRLGFPAMKFADCSFVKSDALERDQLRFSVSIQSFSPNTNGLSTDGYYGAIVDGKIGVAIDYATGLLTLNFTNLFQDEVLSTLNTKIQIHVFLKKGGFNNRPIFVDSVKVQNMLQLISVFSGAVSGGPSALVDLGADITGVLPVIHGGTGLNATGAFGTVLVSNGTGLSYSFLTDLGGVIPFSLGFASGNKIPKTDGYGFLDPSFYYKNPVFIDGFNGVVTGQSASPTTIGAFTFRFDSFILEGLSTIKLEALLETTNAANVAEIQLFNKNTSSYITLTGMTTTSTSTVLLRSQDIKSLLSIGATDFIYEVRLKLNPASVTELATCKLVRLVMTYNNLTLNSSTGIAPPISRSFNFVPFLPSPTPS